MPRSLKVKEGRITLIATDEAMEMELDGTPLGRKFSPSAVTDLTRALFKLSDKVQGTELYQTKHPKKN